MRWALGSALPSGFRMGRRGYASGPTGLEIQSGEVWRGSLDPTKMPEAVWQGVSRTFRGSMSSLSASTWATHQGALPWSPSPGTHASQHRCPETV